jgi:hypothetical protein
VVQEALFSAGVDPAHHVAVSVRGAYKVKTTNALDAALGAVPVIAATARTRREPVISAVALFPA